jgi:hypothetical protein
MRVVWMMAGMLTVVSTASLMAQRAASPFARWEAPVLVYDSDTLLSPQGDYRYEGLAFGGLVFGALGAYLGSRNFESCALEPGGDCGNDRNKLGDAIAVGLVGAAVGGGLGYLVGRFSPKKPRPDSLITLQAELASVPDSARRQVGYQHWRGAGIGMAIGAGVGAVTGALLSRTPCSDCRRHSTGESALLVGLLGAGSGGVMGFLAGLASPQYAPVPASGRSE